MSGIRFGTAGTRRALTAATRGAMATDRSARLSRAGAQRLSLTRRRNGEPTERQAAPWTAGAMG